LLAFPGDLVIPITVGDSVPGSIQLRPEILGLEVYAQVAYPDHGAAQSIAITNGLIIRLEPL
jgi:hypothetical protein